MFHQVVENRYLVVGYPTPRTSRQVFASSVASSSTTVASTVTFAQKQPGHPVPNQRPVQPCAVTKLPSNSLLQALIVCFFKSIVTSSQMLSQVLPQPSLSVQPGPPREMGERPTYIISTGRDPTHPTVVFTPQMLHVETPPTLLYFTPQTRQQRSVVALVLP